MNLSFMHARHAHQSFNLSPQFENQILMQAHSENEVAVRGKSLLRCSVLKKLRKNSIPHRQVGSNAAIIKVGGQEACRYFRKGLRVQGTVKARKEKQSNWAGWKCGEWKMKRLCGWSRSDFNKADMHILVRGRRANGEANQGLLIAR